MFSFLRSLMSWPGRGSYGRTREREAGNAAPGGRDGGLPLAQSCHSKGLAGIWLCTIWSCTAAAEGRQRGDMAFGARKGEQAAPARAAPAQAIGRPSQPRAGALQKGATRISPQGDNFLRK